MKAFGFMLILILVSAIILLWEGSLLRYSASVCFGIRMATVLTTLWLVGRHYRDIADQKRREYAGLVRAIKRAESLQQRI